MINNLPPTPMGRRRRERKERGAVTEPSNSELRQMARKLFGRDIDAARIATFRARLVHMARVKALLEDWDGRLGESEPVTVYRVPAPEGREP